MYFHVFPQESVISHCRGGQETPPPEGFGAQANAASGGQERYGENQRGPAIPGSLQTAGGTEAEVPEGVDTFFESLFDLTPFFITSNRVQVRIAGSVPSQNI